MKEILHSQSKFVKQLCEALDITDDWRRIIIDITRGEVVIIHLERYADSTKLDLLKPDISEARILREDKLK